MNVINQTVRMFDRVSMVKDGSPDWGRGGDLRGGRGRDDRTGNVESIDKLGDWQQSL